MIYDILLLLLLVIACEAVTEIITASEITNPIRSWWKKYTYKLDIPPDDTFIQKVKIFLDKLISCGYCTSVWVAMPLAFFSPFTLSVIWWMIMVFVIHRLSNWLHVVYELVRKGRVNTHDLLVKLTVEQENGSVREDSSEEYTET